jgi:hypothetical protein
MDRYGIILGKEPLSVERPSVCAFCNHGKTYCHNEAATNDETIIKVAFYCTREQGHKGPHIACSSTEHNLKTWAD